MFGLDAILGAAQGLPGFLTGLLPDQGPPPPPEPSLLDDPAIQAALAGLGNTMSGFQGVADQFLNPAGQAGNYSPEYRAGLSGGGTGAQNARFERMYDPRKVEADAIASLMNDPVFGHLFGGGNSAPNVTSYAESQPVPEITNETIAAMRSAGQLDGTSGVRLAPEQQSQALQRRLDRRAEEQAALENMRWSPMDFGDPMQKMAFAYEAWAADQQAAERAMERQRQAAIQQAKMAAERADRLEKSRQFDATLKSDSDYQDALLGIERDKLDILGKPKVEPFPVASLQEWTAVTYGDGSRLTPEMRARIPMEYADYVENMRRRGEGGGSDPFGLGDILDRFTGAFGGIPGLGGPGEPGLMPRTATLEDLEQTKGMSREQQATFLRAKGWTNDEIVNHWRQEDPNAIGIAIGDPYGSSSLYESQRFNPGLPMFWDDLFGSPIQKAMFRGYDPAAAQNDFLRRDPNAQPTAAVPSLAPKKPLSTPFAGIAPPVSGF